MSDQANSRKLFTPVCPSFLVGVTGYMELSDAAQDELRPRIVRLFRFLRYGANFQEPGSDKPVLEKLIEDLAPPSDAGMREAYRATLGRWTGLHKTPIVLMSALAPGADTLVVETILDLQTYQPGDEPVQVRAPLALPIEWYEKGTTFSAGDANKKAHRVARFKKLVDTIGADHCFVVRLEADHHRSKAVLEDLYSRQHTGDAERVARHERFYAAGEYLAVHSHLLLAIWNGQNENTSAGTAAVVHARLSGPRAGVLPNTLASALPHGGPLLHLFAPRGEDTNPRLPAMRFLHPFIFASKPKLPAGMVIAEGQESDHQMQFRRLTTFTNAAMDLERFNQLGDGRSLNTKFVEMFIGSKNVQRALAEEPVAAAKTLELTNLPVTLQDRCPPLLQGLRLNCDIRRKAADNSVNFDASAKATLLRLFCITFAAALAMHFFSDWKPKDSNDRSVNWVQVVFGLGALAAGLGGLIYFLIQRHKRVDERAHDYRAMAEGLRVQFYWNLAGVGSSASASYMQRQRSELDWIRGVIRSLNLPYYRWTDWFNTLKPEQQLLSLESVHRGWVKEQLDYFHGRFEQHHYDHHSRQRFAAAAALSAMWIVGVSCLELCCGAFRLWMEEGVTKLAWVGAAAIVLAAAASFSLRWMRSRHDSGTEIESVEIKKNWWQRPVEWFLPPGDEDDRSLSASFKGFMGYLMVSFGWAALTLSLSHALSEFPRTPECENLEVIFAGAWLLVAGIAVAYAEKKLFSELAYQFNIMASLFTHADLRMEAELATLKRLCESAMNDAADLALLVNSDTTTEADTGTKPAEAAWQTAEVQAAASRKKFDQQISCIQQFLEALGKEALDEHAEWLLLHRARPLEPVMPG